MKKPAPEQKSKESQESNDSNDNGARDGTSGDQDGRLSDGNVPSGRKNWILDRFFLRRILPALIGALATITAAAISKSDLFRFDVLIPTSKVQILDDFVFVHFDGYREKGAQQPLEIYASPDTNKEYEIFDKATYVEYVWLRKTKANYRIQLTSSGVPPDIKAISPEHRKPETVYLPDGSVKKIVDLSVDQDQQFRLSGQTPNPKVIYVYRNAYQGSKSFAGKNVHYETDRLTFVVDFSALANWETLIHMKPAACLKRAQETEEQDLPLKKWDKGVAIVEAFGLHDDDRVRIFWTWSRAVSSAGAYPPIACREIL